MAVQQSAARVLKAAEYQRLLRHSRDASFRQILLVARYTGASPEWLRRLSWDRVAWEEGCFLAVADADGSVSDPKRGRRIPFPPVVEQLLRRLARRAPLRRVVFLDGSGRPWRAGVLERRLRLLARQAGIGPDALGEDLTFEAFRRAYILAACAEGVGVTLLGLLTGAEPVQVAQVALRAAEALRRLSDAFWPRREQAAARTDRQGVESANGSREAGCDVADG